jgi:lipopolysaccharide transport system ATP-binding protein
MELPQSAVIGLIGDANSGTGDLLKHLAGKHGDRVIVFDYSLDVLDAVEKAWAEIRVEDSRRTGASIVVASHDRDLLRRISDEVWWIEQGRIREQGHPSEILAGYERDALRRIRERAGEDVRRLHPSLRRGDGRARLIGLAALDASGKPVHVCQSGDALTIRVEVQFQQAVDDPVVGIMIRTRIGMEVYGTNTQLEKVKIGPCAPGDARAVSFGFACSLCPQDYTVTAASHDPDGVWHDWMEDALAFTVVDTRYTAGVANLRAEVRIEQI